MNRLNGIKEAGQDSQIMTHSSIDSERYYRGEIYSLEKKLSSNPKCIDSIKSWIENYHHLASIYQERGEHMMAQKCYLIPHHSMLYMARHKKDEESELIAIHAINLTLPALMKFAEEYPPCKKCLRDLREQMQMIEKTISNYH
ncbi:hypothetical protein [Vibrio sp. HN007]|uniref:hypothetical protein n=1 Tax=Vibrio iocasae TaxID=3098914 RepID=UPI0035D493CB